MEIGDPEAEKRLRMTAGRYPIAFAALVVGIAIGWLGSRNAAGPVAPPAVTGPALSAALAEGSPTQRLRRMTEAVADLDASDVDALVDFIERERSVLTEWEVRLLFEAWGRLDPVAAATHPFSEWGLQKRQVAMEAVVESWALGDPLAARDFVDLRLEQLPRRSRYLIHPFVVGWVHSGVPGVFDYITELPVPSRPAATLAMVGSQVRRLGVEGLLQWAESRVGQGNETLQRDFFRRVAKAAARRDPAAASVWVMAHVDQEYAIDGVRLVAERWLPRAPDAAFAWLSDEAPERLRVAALESAASRWMTRDLDGAGEWLESRSLAPLHDPILAVYARRLATRDGESAIAWAERVQGGARRIEILQEVATLWYSRAPAAAEVWLETSPLVEDARHAVRRPPPGKKPRRSPPAGGRG